MRWEMGSSSHVVLQLPQLPKLVTLSKDCLFYNHQTQACTNLGVSLDINQSIKIIGKSVYQLFKRRIYYRLYMKSSCHALHMRFTDLYLYSVFFIFSEIHFLERSIFFFTLDIASLKVSLVFSYSGRITGKEKNINFCNFHPAFQWCSNIILHSSIWS